MTAFFHAFAPVPLAFVLGLAACGQPAPAAPAKPVAAAEARPPAPAAAAPAAAAAEDEAHDDGITGYVWHTTHENESAQYGVPDSDDRALRIDCEPSGKLSIMGPTSADPAGSAVQVELRGWSGTRHLPGTVVELGDGNNFAVEVEPDDDAISTLMGGADLIVGSVGDLWTIPGKGAAKALAPVIEVCKTR